jgi:RND superfamily putative drug exporter
MVFLLSGVRYHLAGGAGRSGAARAAVEEYGPVIVTAGFMVAAGAAVLVLASTRIFRAFGPGMAFTVLVGLLVAITLGPALLSLLGRYAFWPSAPRPWPGLGAAGAEEAPARGTLLSRLVAWRPAAAVLAALTVVVLVAAAAPLRDASLGFDVIQGLPAGAGPRVAAEAAGQGFAAGILSPTEVVVRAPGVAEEQGALVRLQQLIQGIPGVTGVLGPAQRPQAVTQLRSALRVDEALILAPDGGAARYLVVFNADPSGSAGIDRYDALRASMPAFLREAGLAGAEVSYAGDTAVAEQVIDRTLSDLVRIALAVALVDFLLLVVFLRALIAPLFLVAASVLALAASAGITVVVFQRLFGVQDVVYYVPFAAAVLLVSLGSDYNVFLVGRIWDEARTVPLKDAVRRGVPRATRAISIAALALAASFALLGLIDVVAFRQLAVLLAVGVLVDAFFVRSLLVPSLITLVGTAGAWPCRRGGRQSTERA